MTSGPIERARAELVLYVLDGSPACAATIETLFRILAHFDPRDVRATVRNLSREVRVDADRWVLVVPTLLMVEPVRVYLVRDLSEPAILGLLASVALTPGPERFRHPR